MLLEHNKIYLGPEGERTDAVLERDGRVEALGERARQLAERGEQRISPDSECVMPGLADAHCHLWGVGRRLGTIDLKGTESPEELYERLREQRDESGPTEWLLGQGWDQHNWTADQRAAFHRRRLDELFSDRPVCLHRVDSHAVMCNTEALHRGRIMGDRVSQTELQQEVDEAGGRIERDEKGEPTGLLVDAAMRPVLDAIPNPTRKEDEQLMREAAGYLVEQGVTSVHLARVEVERLEMLRDLEQAGALPMRMYALVDGMDPDLPEVLQDGPDRDPEARLSVAGLKLFADGALGSQGALLLDGYPDGSSGLEDVDPDELSAKVVSWMGNGWQVAVHAIGDLANQRVLDAYDLVPHAVRRDVRPRIEHAQMMTDRDIERISELATIASVQPIHMRSDAVWAGEMLSDQQCRRLFRWRELNERTGVAAGSDFPIEDPNPWHGIATFMSRRDRDGRSFFPDQALARSDAIAAYTTGAAHAAHWEDHVGRLQSGMCADMVALDTDPFEADPDSLWETEVDEVWIGGEPQLESNDES